MATRTDNRLMKSLTFGCELEFTGITREQAAKVIARFFRAPALYEGDGYDKRIVKDTCGRKWAIMRDSSIRPQRKGGRDRRRRLQGGACNADTLLQRHRDTAGARAGSAESRRKGQPQLRHARSRRRREIHASDTIAYGSNMDFSQMRRRCPDAELVGAGIVKNYELLFKGSGSGSYATIEKKARAKVPVLVWRISALDEEALDRYEGFPTFYYKTQLSVMMQDGAEITGMVYIMHEDRALGFPSRRYARVLYDAYVNFGWDCIILNKALKKSAEAQPHISR